MCYQNAASTPSSDAVKINLNSVLSQNKKQTEEIYNLKQQLAKMSGRIQRLVCGEVEKIVASDVERNGRQNVKAQCFDVPSKKTAVSLLPQSQGKPSAPVLADPNLEKFLALELENQHLKLRVKDLTQRTRVPAGIKASPAPLPLHVPSLPRCEPTSTNLNSTSNTVIVAQDVRS